MKSFKVLREEKEYLSRELAESCRDYVTLSHKYQEIICSYRFVKTALAQKMLESKEAASLEAATLKIEQYVDTEMMKTAQLSLPLTERSKP